MTDYKEQKAQILAFFENHLDPYSQQNTYLLQLDDIANRKSRVFNFYLDDLGPGELQDAILNNTRRYQQLIAEAVDQALPAPTTDIVEDIFDVLERQRRLRLQSNLEATGVDAIAAREDPQNALPPELMRRYEVVIHPPAKMKALKMREVTARHIGKLVTVRGIVTHVTDVKPLLTVATYLDESTGYEVYQQITGPEFTPLLEPPQKLRAGGNGARPSLILQSRGSKFVRYQELKLQELPLEVPTGSTPRSLMVHLRGQITRSCKPGDCVTLGGIFLPQPEGRRFGGSRMGLVTKTFLDAMSVHHDKQSYDMVALDDKIRAEIEEVSASSDIYDRLAHSLAPEIWGS
eukprot:jgi/Botrbrau1/21336/Bobra.0184s0046.1